MATPPLRDDCWLESRLKHLWDTYYHEGPQGYPIRVNFGRPARYRYGSIFNQGRTCRILINGVFANPGVPEYVVDATVAHELAHYVHGYASGLPKLHSHPHRGGVIDKEMERRGCYFLEEMAVEWRRSHWQAFYEGNSRGAVEREVKAEKRQAERWSTFLRQPGFRTEEQLHKRLSALSLDFGFDSAPFDANWLLASVRRSGLSYRFRNETSIRLNAVLAHPKVPKEVIDYELSYWLAVERVGSRWDNVEKAIQAAGNWDGAGRAIRWRRRVWPQFRLEHLPKA